MLRVVSTMFSSGFVAASGHTAVTLGTDGDTLRIVVETLVCVVLLSVVIFCKHRHRLRTE